MTFLPKDAKEPKSKSNYTMPLAEGSVKLRVMSPAIVGYEGWKEEEGKKTPVRYTVNDAPPFGPDGREPKYFWAFVVWNYEQEQLQIMSVTQKTIRMAFEAYVLNEDWGDPKNYDIVLSRKGTKLEDTEYTVIASPHSEVSEAIQEAYNNAQIDLEEWRKGGDPFEKKNNDF